MCVVYHHRRVKRFLTTNFDSPEAAVANAGFLSSQSPPGTGRHPNDPLTDGGKRTAMPAGGPTFSEIFRHLESRW